MITSAVLLGGTVGFAAACSRANVISARQGPRTVILKNQKALMILAGVLGFISLALVHTFGPLTDFLPNWINAFLWTALLCAPGGMGIGHYLGRAFEINVKLNRTPNVRHSAPSALPTTVGTLLGMIAYLVIMSL